MNALLTTAAEIQSFLRDAGERFCFIGGVALQRWGEPRFTRDVDLTLLCPYGDEAQATERLLAGFSARIPDAKAFAVQHRVVLLSGASGIPIDVALGGIPFEDRCVARASAAETLQRTGRDHMMRCAAASIRNRGFLSGRK